VNALARYFNSTYLIQIEHSRRIVLVTWLFLATYALLGLVIYFQEYEFAFFLGFITCMVHQFSRAIGEAVIVGYLKAVPQELIIPFSSGTGVASFFSILTTLLLNEFGFANSPYCLLFVILTLPYYLSFQWIEAYRLAHKQYIARPENSLLNG